MSKVAELPDENVKSVKFQCFAIKQPIGDLYVGVMPWRTLCDIASFDVRRIIREQREVETYIGIQRPLNPNRLEELRAYVNLKDATFPTGIILAVEAECATYDAAAKTMTLTNYMDAGAPEERIFYRDIARVIDGQHRIAGLEGYSGETFDLPVTMLVGMDIADQAYVFSTVNLAQTKVNPSLAYDLYSLAKARSPQKSCHNIAVALDQHEKSPFYHRIKRLGVATDGRFDETLTQAQFVRALLRYISADPVMDRDILLRGNTLSKVGPTELQKLIFRNMFIDEQELKIMDVVWNFFSAVKDRWPTAWGNVGRGNILNRTNGFRALMRFLRPCYLFVTRPGNVPTKPELLKVLQKANLHDTDFTVDRFKPGSSGEALLFNTLVEQTGVQAS